MKKENTPRPMVLLTTLLAGCFLLSSCGIDTLLGKGDDSDTIKSVVEAYLDEIKDGDLTDNEYESAYAEDAPFADLSFEDDAVIEIMDKGLTKMEYSIEAAQGSVKKEEGTCDVTVTAVDMEEVLSVFEDESFDAEELMDAVKDKKVPMTDYEITLDLVYSTSDKEWFVSDSYPLVEILGDPYTEITFGLAAGSPTALIDTFMTALTTGDAAAIDLISPYYDSATFFDEDPITKSMQQAFYSKITYEFVGDLAGDESYPEVTINLTMPDLKTIVNQVAGDTEFMAGTLKQYLLESIQGVDTTDSEKQSLQMYSDKLSELFNASDVPMLTSEVVFTLEINSETGGWDLYDIPTELSDIDSEPDGSEDLYTQAVLRSLEMLLTEGSIDQATYDEFAAYYSGIVPTESTTTGTDSGTTPQSDIIFAGWYDYYSGSYVTEYDSATTYTIEYDIQFYNNWTGLVVYYDYYNENGSVVVWSSSETIQADQYDVYASLETEDYSLIPADTYYVIMYLEDGTILADEYVTVY